MTTHACHLDGEAEIDRLLDVMSNRLRRAVIYYFEEQTERTVESLSSLAAYLSAVIPSLATNAAKIKLIHKHLPQLETTGWLEFDGRTETVVYHGNDYAATLLADLRMTFTDEHDD
ncbi:hypothetical protein G6M89_03700 [Natronolimnobius sp. AArcel1]|uniref:DUF7344 domain-containing protein n=1 Tax=Natronolimnobius sp. AArcel1 TaxID=1679093 RepID=UPI0013EAF31D|nr:hypothetical protein [Natronolimnobius sp. AArcel1]NGM68123.1 hypothetical protein [Natronolimnobius sp. AArcel1]